MSEVKLSERDLVIRFRNAKDKRDKLKTALTKAQQEFDEAGNDLIETLQAQDKKSTAKFEGIGSCGLVKPRLYARFDKENESDVFEYLREEGREDLIKETVNSQSLSSFVKERLEEGQTVTEKINYYLQTTARFYPER